jgi:hypothetical protein
VSMSSYVLAIMHRLADEKCEVANRIMQYLFRRGGEQLARVRFRLVHMRAEVRVGPDCRCLGERLVAAEPYAGRASPSGSSTGRIADAAGLGVGAAPELPLRRSCYRRLRRSSIPSGRSGSLCAQTIFLPKSSRPATASSKQPAPPRTYSSKRPQSSHRSECTNGRIAVNCEGRWYKMVRG